MPDTRGRLLPAEVLDALKSSQVNAWLKSFFIQQASAMSIGRYPGNGSAQNDQYVYPDAADASFPYNFDYVIPQNFQRIISAKLSFKIRAYRTYNTITGTNTGAGTSHAHGIQTEAIGESGHSHNHAHTIPIVATVAAADVSFPFNGASLQSSTAAGNTAPINADATGSSGHSHNHGHGSITGGEAGHTHALNLAQTLGITEAASPVNPGITVSVDGTDITAAIGGPFNADQVEIDVTKQLKTGVKLWHTLSLQPNQKVRITGILRLGYYVDSRVAQ